MPFTRAFAIAEKAGSSSSASSIITGLICVPSKRPAASISLTKRFGVDLFARNVTRDIAGAIVLRNSSRLAVSSAATLVNPVMFPPGCARLATMPLPTGSPEPPRVSRRLQTLRGWGHDKTEPVLTGSADAGSADGPGARSGARLAVGGDHLDRREDRLYRGNAPEVGAPGRA